MTTPDLIDLTRPAAVTELLKEARCLACRRQARRCHVEKGSSHCLQCASTELCIFERFVIRSGVAAAFSWTELVGQEQARNQESTRVSTHPSSHTAGVPSEIDNRSPISPNSQPTENAIRSQLTGTGPGPTLNLAPPLEAQEGSAGLDGGQRQSPVFQYHYPQRIVFDSTSGDLLFPPVSRLRLLGQKRALDSDEPPREAPQANYEPLLCPEAGCVWNGKTPSDLKKHLARHNAEYICDLPHCPRLGLGFATINDLIRHKQAVHSLPPEGQPSYRCFALGCNKANKEWPRKDNFKSHLKKLHPEQNMEALLKQSDVWWNVKMLELSQNQQQDAGVHCPDATAKHTNITFADATRVSGRRSGSLSLEQAHQAAKMRALGACWRCRKMREKCSEGEPCGRCDVLKTSGRVHQAQLLCRRGALKEFIPPIVPFISSYWRTLRHEYSDLSSPARTKHIVQHELLALQHFQRPEEPSGAHTMTETWPNRLVGGLLEATTRSMAVMVTENQELHRRTLDYFTAASTCLSYVQSLQLNPHFAVPKVPEMFEQMLDTLEALLFQPNFRDRKQPPIAVIIAAASLFFLVEHSMETLSRRSSPSSIQETPVAATPDGNSEAVLTMYSILRLEFSSKGGLYTDLVQDLSVSSSDLLPEIRFLENTSGSAFWRQLRTRVVEIDDDLLDTGSLDDIFASVYQTMKTSATSYPENSEST